MANIDWVSPIGGDFDVGLNWNGGTVPGKSDNAVLDNLGTDYRVLAQSGLIGLLTVPDQVVAGVQTAAGTTLEILGGLSVTGILDGDTRFTATDGTNGGVNAGLIQIRNNIITGPLGVLLGTTAALEISGEFDNSGEISIDEQPKVLGLLTADQTARVYISGATTLDGGGQVKMSNELENSIIGLNDKATLTNVDNTISGAGAIRGVELDNESAGVIDARGNDRLAVTARHTLVNAGLLDASDGGILVLQNTIENSGTIEAMGGAQVLLKSADVEGGVVMSQAKGNVVTGSAQTELDGGSSTLTISGNFVVRNGDTLTLNGDIDNKGRIHLTSKGAIGSAIDITSGGVTLSGGGYLLSSSVLTNEITGASASASLTNVDDKLFLAGDLGEGLLTLVNDSAGVIMASQKAGLTIDTGSAAITNAGDIISRSAGGLVVKSAIDNTGLLYADGGNITLDGAASGTGQVKISNAVFAAQGAFGENVNFVAAGGTLKLADATAYDGKVYGFSKSGTTLDLEDITFGGGDTVTYSGGKDSGSLTVSDGTDTAEIHLVGDFQSSTFTLKSDGHGGVDVTDPTSSHTAARLTAAMAQMSSSSASSGGLSGSSQAASHATALATPVNG